MVRIPVVVSDDQKHRWREYAENEPSIDSVSDLVRTAVERHIATDESESGQLNDEAINEMLASLDTLERDIGAVETEVKALRTENVREDSMEGLVRDVIEQALDNLDLYAPSLFEPTIEKGGRD